MIEKVLNEEYQRLSRLKYDYEQIISKLPKGSIIRKNRKIPLTTTLFLEKKKK